MVGVGEPFSNTVVLSGSTFTDFFAPSGQRFKVTMVYGSRANDGSDANSELRVKPATGSEDSVFRGVKGPNNTHPPLGSLTSGASIDLLQPVYVTDSQALFLSNNTSEQMDVIVQGVRVA